MIRRLVCATVMALAIGGTTFSTAAVADSANDDCGAYCARPGGESQNGNNNGRAVGRPDAGSVGRADNKNPKGQGPNGNDANNGYECDGNNGVGKGNPAHSGCESESLPY